MKDVKLNKIFSKKAKGLFFRGQLGQAAKRLAPERLVPGNEARIKPLEALIPIETAPSYFTKRD